MDGHLFVWSDSFDRGIDVGICHATPLVGTLSADGEDLAVPAVMEVNGGVRALAAGAMAVLPRPPFIASWRHVPLEHTPVKTVLTRERAAIDQGGLALAQVTLDLLAALSVLRDLHDLSSHYPTLGRLLRHEAQLPSAAGDEAVTTWPPA
ncbi:hypothetical protein [Cryptosporangium sp. NPDC048952]|uniref:hypothetical protein n=1 Tax=Cryptosporangium sp. NPDC048952 TaxID=3363961 RepID=UPI0037168930